MDFPANLPIKYTVEEGGQWYGWVYPPPQRPFAIMFDDGWIFDLKAGWRKNQRYCPICGQRKTD